MKDMTKTKEEQIKEIIEYYDQDEAPDRVDKMVLQLSSLLTPSVDVEKLKQEFERKLGVLGGQAQKASKYGGDVGNIEGQIKGIKWALCKISDIPAENENLSFGSSDMVMNKSYHEQGEKE